MNTSSSTSPKCVTSSLLPTVFHASDIAIPGGVVALQGDRFGAAPEVWFARVESDAVAPTPTVQLRLLTQSNNYLAALIPGDQPFGLYAIWVKADDCCSAPVWVNRARITGFEVSEIAPGGAFRIWGRNLTAAGVESQVRFVDPATNTSLSATVTGGDAYALSVIAPKDLDPGVRYQLFVRNGLGGSLGEIMAEETLPARTLGPDSWQLQVPWAADFTFAHNRYNVKDDSRLALHALGDGVANDRTAIQAAIDQAHADGGGVVYLPAGSYHIDYTEGDGLTMRSRVVLQGDGMERTTISYASETVPEYPDGWGILWPSGTTTSGIADLFLHSADSLPRSIRCWKDCSRLFLQRVRVETNGMVNLSWGEKFLIADSQITVQDTRFPSKKYPNDIIGKERLVAIYYETGITPHHPLDVSCAADYVVRNNTITYYSKRVIALATHHGLFEGNRIIRDGRLRQEGPLQECGGIELSGSSNITLLENTFEGIDVHHNNNDGETILNQGMPDFYDFGWVTGATATTVEDKTKRWPEIPTTSGGKPIPVYAGSPEDSGPSEDYPFLLYPSGVAPMVVAITAGPGMGQWRKIVANTEHAITLDRPWDVMPGDGSKYVITLLPTYRWLVKDNILKDVPRAVWIYTGGGDCAIVGNELINSEGIYLRADQRLHNERRYNLTFDMLVAGNTVTNTNGFKPAHISVVLAHGKPQGYIHGTGTYGVEVRDNTVIGGGMAEKHSSYVHNEGYLCFGGHDERTPGVLGTVFEGNYAANTGHGFHLNTGAHQTVIWNNTVEDAELLDDRNEKDASHASVGTVIGPERR